MLCFLYRGCDEQVFLFHIRFLVPLQFSVVYYSIATYSLDVFQTLVSCLLFEFEIGGTGFVLP
jgi:hypothetical protein